MRLSDVPATTSRRTILLRVLLLLAFVVLGWKAWRLQVLEGGSYREQADYNRMRISNIPPLRGVIYDRNGGMLAVNAPSFVIAVVPADLPRDQEGDVLTRLGGLTGSDPAPLAEALARGR